MSSKNLTADRERYFPWAGVSVLLSLLLLAVLTAGCHSPSREAGSHEPKPAATSPISPLIGQQCVVKLRPDACGTAANIPVPSRTTMFNGAELTLTGKLLEMNDRWVAVEKLESGRVEYWMPRETVFFVRVTRPKEKSGNASETTADYSASDDPASSSRPATEMRVRWHSGMM